MSDEVKEQPEVKAYSTRELVDRMAKAIPDGTPMLAAVSAASTLLGGLLIQADSIRLTSVILNDVKRLVESASAEPKQKKEPA